MKNSIEGKNIVIIGSGVGGSERREFFLSLLNFRVTIVEKNAAAEGGLMRSYRRAKIDCPKLVSTMSAPPEKKIEQPWVKCFDFWAYRWMISFAEMGQEGVIDRYI